MIGPFLRQISFRLSALWRRRRRKSTFTCLGPRRLEGSCTGHGGLLGRTPAHSKQTPLQRHSSSVSPCQQGKVLNSSTCVTARDPDKINKVELENEDPRNMIQEPPIWKQSDFTTSLKARRPHTRGLQPRLRELDGTRTICARIPAHTTLHKVHYP